MADRGKRGLGRGLEALLRSQHGEEAVDELQKIVVTQIHANRYQPRRSFDAESMQELADSISANGVLEPLLLRPLADGYEVVAGERRLRAARLAGLDEVPAIVRHFDDKQTAEIALIENLQRADLNPIEEAHAFQRLLQEFQLTQEELASRVGRSRSHLTNTLRLLQLPPQVQEHLLNGTLEMGHARALLPLPVEQQLFLCQEVVEHNLSVRQTEAKVRAMAKQQAEPAQSKPKRSRDIQHWESRLTRNLQTKVVINASGRGAKRRGTIEIAFYDNENLERLMDLLLNTETQL